MGPPHCKTKTGRSLISSAQYGPFGPCHPNCLNSHSLCLYSWLARWKKITSAKTNQTKDCRIRNHKTALWCGAGDARRGLCQELQCRVDHVKFLSNVSHTNQYPERNFLNCLAPCSVSSSGGGFLSVCFLPDTCGLKLCSLTKHNPCEERDAMFVSFVTVIAAKIFRDSAFCGKDNKVDGLK